MRGLRRRFLLSGLLYGVARAAPGLAAPGLAATGIGGPFVLVNGAGHSVTEADFRGRYLLVTFGYTSCPDTCPATLYKLAAVLRRLGLRSASLRVVFISVDPVRDSPALTAHYAALFSPDIIGLSGSATQLQRVAADFHVYVGPENPDTGAIAHGSLLYLMDPAGRFVAALPAGLGPRALTERLMELMTKS